MSDKTTGVPKMDLGNFRIRLYMLVGKYYPDVRLQDLTVAPINRRQFRSINDTTARASLTHAGRTTTKEFPAYIVAPAAYADIEPEFCDLVGDWMAVHDPDVGEEV